MLTHDFILVEHVPARIRYTEYDKAAMTRISDEFARAHWQAVFGAVDVYADYCGNLIRIFTGIICQHEVKTGSCQDRA